MAGVFVTIGYLTRGQNETASTLQEARIVVPDDGNSTPGVSDV
jgi:hypothetical protein